MADDMKDLAELMEAWQEGLPNGNFTDFGAEWPICVESVLQLFIHQATRTGKLGELAGLLNMYAEMALAADKKPPQGG